MKLRNVLKAAALAAIAVAPASGQAAPGSAAVAGLLGHLGTSLAARFERFSSGPTALVKPRAHSRGPKYPDPARRRLNKNPILKPESAETVRNMGEQSKSHFGFHNPRNQCWPNGLPLPAVEQWAADLRRGNHLTMIYREDHQLRTVRMNGRHPANVKPSYYAIHWPL